MKRFLAAISLCGLTGAVLADPPTTLDAGDVTVTWTLPLFSSGGGAATSPTASANTLFWGANASAMGDNDDFPTPGETDSDFSFAAKAGFVITGYDVSYEFSVVPDPITAPVLLAFTPAGGTFTDHMGTHFASGAFEGTLTNHLTVSQFLPQQVLSITAAAGVGCTIDLFECQFPPNLYFDPVLVVLKEVTIHADVQTLSPVPEPATYALVLGGLCLLGLTWRRHAAPLKSSVNFLPRVPTAWQEHQVGRFLGILEERLARRA